MKYFLFCLLALSTMLGAQVNSVKTNYVNAQNYLSVSSLKEHKDLYGDSLKGFDEAGTKEKLLGNSVTGQEYIICMQNIKRNFINNKYKIGPAFNKQAAVAPVIITHKPIGGNNTINAGPCMNEDFEATPVGYAGGWSGTAITGWSVSSVQPPNSSCLVPPVNPGSSQIWIVNTPVSGVPGIGTLLASPLGGNNVVQLHNTTAIGLSTRITHTISVTPANTIFQFAFAGAWTGGDHVCCTAAQLNIRMFDCNGQPLNCYSINAVATVSCSNVPINYISTNGIAWTDWQVKYIDLSSYIGSCVRFEVTNSHCSATGHYGMAYFDAKCSNTPAGTAVFTNSSVASATVGFCPGTSQVVLNAPAGYASYQWVSSATGTIPANQGGTAATYTLTNPPPNSVYTISLVSNDGCIYGATIPVIASQVSVASIASGTSCAGGGAYGTATVTGAHSSNGYNYTWFNAANNVVSTTSQLTNVPAGVYSASLTAIGLPGCGSAVASTTVYPGPQAIINVSAPYCGIFANLSAPGAGSGYRWYNGSMAIPAAQGGTASTYTVISAVNGAVFRLSYLNTQGCRDSVKYTLTQLPSGGINITNSPSSCPGTSQGSVAISLTPAPGAPVSNNAFTITSWGNTAPAYSVSLNPTSALSFTAGNLFVGGTYSIVAFDGSCYYQAYFLVNTSQPNFNYTVTPATSTVCAGQTYTAGIITAGPASAYTYSWLPANAITNNTLQTVALSPLTVPGTTTSFIYTVVVTPGPGYGSCPLSQTLSLTCKNPATPTISPVPQLCSNAPDFTITTAPAGGVFYNVAGGNNIIGFTSGVLSPGLALTGINTFTYSYMADNCTASSVGSYTMHPAPVVNITAPVIICKGEPATLSAGGADAYVWNDGVNGPVNVVSPAQASTYTVTGTTLPQNCSARKTIAISVDDCTGINITPLENVLRVYPNPAIDELTVETIQSVKIFIYDGLGKLILEQDLPSGKNNISMTDYSSGIYLLKAISGNQIKTLKLVKRAQQ